MARPLKLSLDYSRLESGFFEQEKVIALRREHGALGISTFFFLRTRIDMVGYYLKFSNLNDLAMTVAENIGSKREPTAKVAARVLEVMRYCAEIGLFDKHLFAQNCITSVGIQEYYAFAKERCGGRALIKEFSLLSEDNAFEIVSEENTAVYVTKIGVSATKTQNNVAEMRQSKVKVNKSINSVCNNDRLQGFCKKWNVQNDTTLTQELDFEQLDLAYSESSKFLQSKPVARWLSWVVKNYSAIVAGKYKDFDESTNQRVKMDDSAEELNRAFNLLNKDL